MGLRGSLARLGFLRGGGAKSKTRGERRRRSIVELLHKWRDVPFQLGVWPLAILLEMAWCTGLSNLQPKHTRHAVVESGGISAPIEKNLASPAAIEELASTVVVISPTKLYSKLQWFLIRLAMHVKKIFDAQAQKFQWQLFQQHS